MIFQLVPVICSALLHAAAFLCPKYFFWCAFISLIPLRGEPLFNKKNNFLWGIIFNSLFLWGLLPFLHTFAHGPLKFIPYGLLVLYFSTISYFLRPTSPWYHVFIYYAALVPFGQLHGVPLMNPLVPLAEHPQLLIATHYMGVMGLTFILLLFQYLLARKSWWSAVCLFPFALGFFVHEKQPTHLNTVAYLAPAQKNHAYPCDIAQNISERIARIHPKPSLILLPEGTFLCPFNTMKAPENILISAAGSAEIVFGSHRKEQGKFYNCAYHIRSGICKPIYDKEYCVPFAEYVPAPWSWSAQLTDLFLQGHEQLCPSETRYTECSLPIGPMTPQICYDLYFRPTAPSSCAPILLLTNDSWYPAYLQNLLFLCARLRAVAWGRDIWYIAHTGGWWLGKKGGKAILRTV